MNPTKTTRGTLANIGLPLGPIAACVVYGLGLAFEWPVEARTTAGIVAWMALWWMTEAIPLAATALIPLIAIPLLPVYSDTPVVGQLVEVAPPEPVAGEPNGERGAMVGRVISVDDGNVVAESYGPDGQRLLREATVDEVSPHDAPSDFERAAAPYANRFIFLFLGGFLIALAIERWNLHKRIALVTLNLFGTSPIMIIAGFMCATAGLSMWISNTATTVMMLPIAMGVATRLAGGKDPGKDPGKGTTGQDDADDSPPTDRNQQRFSTCLLLAIAYAASIGGIATLVGTPPNALLAGFLKDQGRPLDFASWMMFALPVSIVFLVMAWLVLTQVVFRFRLPPLPEGRKLFREELRKLGPMSAGEWVTLVVFAATAFTWIARKPLSQWEWFSDRVSMIGQLNDSVIALIGGLCLFLIPVARKPVTMAMDWETAKRLPWGILLLFGGGLSLAGAVQGSGLGTVIGNWVASFDTLSVVGMMILVTVVVVFLTEFTSNVATTSLFLPILFQVAGGLEFPDGSPVPAEYLLVPATLAASCAFMLPVATPPNAIVFSSERIAIPQMARAGFALNMVSCILLPIAILILGPRVLGF